MAYVLAFMEISFVFFNSFSKHFSKQKSQRQRLIALPLQEGMGSTLMGSTN